MKRSFLRLVVTSVLAAWVVSFVTLAVYVTRQSWTEERARHDGVFFVYDTLAELPAGERASRLRTLQPHFWPPLHLLSRGEAEGRLGRDIAPGQTVHQRVYWAEEWYFLAFDDGAVLAAGPIDPVKPPYAVPIALPLVVILLPLIAGFIALRVERELSKVERASEKLATGELSARVDNPDGPSNELAAAFNVMAERVERLIRGRDELVQAVSHELGSPLARLRFHMALLEDPPDGGREERLAAMTRELDALDELVAELLSYVQSDELLLDRVSFDPHRPLADIVELASLEAPEFRDLDFTLEVPDVEVCADQRLFLRAVENVLRNAAQHAESRVRLEVFDEGEHVRVAVHDDGPGIPEDERERVMTPFARLEPDRDRTTGGVGLGLAIVRRILDRHDGRLAIDASELGGACVIMRWPRSP